MCRNSQPSMQQPFRLRASLHSLFLTLSISSRLSDSLSLSVCLSFFSLSVSLLCLIRMDRLAWVKRTNSFSFVFRFERKGRGRWRDDREKGGMELQDCHIISFCLSLVLPLLDVLSVYFFRSLFCFQTCLSFVLTVYRIIFMCSGEVKVFGKRCLGFVSVCRCVELPQGLIAVFVVSL